MTASSSTDLASRIQRARVGGVERLTLLAGTSSACAIARDGGSFPAYKFHEGRVAAWGMAAKALRSGDEAPDAIARDLVRRWEEDVERRATQGRDWQAYAAGGLDAARELASWVGIADSS